MGSVFRLTLRQMVGRWRLLIMTVLAAMPVFITLLVMRAGRAPSVEEFELVVFSAMLAGSISPLVVLAISTAAFGNEIEDRTLANLTLSPIPRWKIALPKLLAAITIAAPFIGVSALASSWIAFLGDPRAVFAVTAAALVGVALYASAFVWLGLVSTQAIGIGLLYIVLWEGFFSGFVSGVRVLSIRHYSISLMHAFDARRFASFDNLSAPVAAGISIAIVAGFLLLSVRRLRTMDVP
jgi:ABC-2 type transport system permease protein